MAGSSRRLQNCMLVGILMFTGLDDMLSVVCNKLYNISTLMYSDLVYVTDSVYARSGELSCCIALCNSEIH